MKRILSLILCVCVILTLTACGSKKEEPGIDVYVSISVAGELKLAAEKIRVTDADGDGAYTVNDVLIAAHTAKAPNKAESFGTEETQYGLSIIKLWDDANGMYGYGYYVNNNSAFSLTDPVAEGDYVYAFSYADLAMWSDVYAWFDSFMVDAGNELTFHLSQLGYDANWNTVVADCAGAEILVDGLSVGTTDENGNCIVSVNASKGASVVVSAALPDAVIVPPVCLVIGK